MSDVQDVEFESGDPQPWKRTIICSVQECDGGAVVEFFDPQKRTKAVSVVGGRFGSDSVNRGVIRRMRSTLTEYMTDELP